MALVRLWMYIIHIPCSVPLTTWDVIALVINLDGSVEWARFAESILPLIDKDLNRSVNIVNDVLTSFSDIYQSKWLEMML